MGSRDAPVQSCNARHTAAEEAVRRGLLFLAGLLVGAAAFKTLRPWAERFVIQTVEEALQYEAPSDYKNPFGRFRVIK